jgi:hypothetical protein
MNCTRKNSSTFILKVFNSAAKFIISRTCSCIPRVPSNFMVVSLVISVPARDLSAVLKCSATLARNSLASSVFGSIVLMFFAIVIRINSLVYLTFPMLCTNPYLSHYLYQWEQVVSQIHEMLYLDPVHQRKTEPVLSNLRN